MDQRSIAGNEDKLSSAEESVYEQVTEAVEVNK